MVGSDKVKNMFKKKFPSLSSLGSDGNTSFLRAARAGHLDKVLEQLRSNVDINTSNANGLNALHLASKDGHVHVVTELLKRGANVDSATKKGNTALHIASLAGQEEVVRLLVEHGASVNVQSQNGFTPLYMAAQENHDNVVKYLLANGANQSLATEDGFTPLAVAMQQGHDKVVAVLLENDTRGKVRLPALHIAAKKDDCKAAALLLQNEHNPDVTSKSGFTPLHIASHYGNEGIANLLLNKGADVNYSAKHNITPLHVAAKWGKSNMVSLLLEKGANIESKTRDGLTPLHCAARSGHEQVVDMLLERGAPISCKTKNGLAPLHMSSQGDHVDAARILLYHRAPVDEVTVDYLTALHVAAHCGHARVAKLLLDRKADPNARALNGFTPLHIACKKNRIKVVELLLKHGASIEATTESGLTPLHVASFMGCMNIVIYLLQNEASPDVPTVRGETPLHLAARANQTDIIRILLRNGAQVDARAREQQTALHIASRLGNVDIVMLLLQHGAAVDCTTKDLYSALHIAAKEGQDEVASVLLENGASPTATTKKGFTPLHLAAKYGNMKVARLLLQRDAPVDAQGKNGVTPLHVASHYDHQNVALLLLDKGASPHATAKNGHTPLHIAAKKNQMDIATTLLEYGAKANSESKAGFTPLHLSAQEGHVDMSSILIDHQADTNHKAKNGLTPLHLCAQEDRVNVATVLIKNGAEIDATTKAGYTPLHVACHFGQLNMVRLLLDEGSQVGTATAVGYTPLHQAAQQGHCTIVHTLLEHGAPPNATTNQGQTAMSIAQKLGYISVVESLKGVTETTTITPLGTDEKYKVVSPETMQETFMSDSEDEGGEDTLLSEQPYRYLTVDEMKSLGDDSLPIDVRQDERLDSNRECMTVPPTAVDDTISPQHLKEAYSQFTTPDNIDISKHPLHVGFLVSFLVDARGGAMRGCRHSGVRVIVPPRRASMPMRVTCRYLKRDKLSHPPPLMEGEALASRILELGPVGAKFLGPVMIEVPHFGSLRGKEREIVILRSDNGETWREHTVDCSEEAVQDVLSHSFDKEDLGQLEDNARTTRILTTDFPHYLAVVTRVRQEVHAIGPEGGMVSSSVVPQVQAVFPQGALTKKIKVGLQAQPIAAELAAKLLGNRVAVSPIVTVEPRRRKFHKPITLTIPKPQAANKGMINQYSGDAPTLRLLCSITGGTTRAQWEDVTGSTPFTFVNDCVSFTTTVSARFWLMDCRNVGDATKMATELYREAIHVPFMAKFVVFAKRVDPMEARLRIFCMTDDKEDKTLEHQEHFTEVAKSRDVEVLEGKTQYVEFAGNLVPVTKSGEQLQLGFRAFRENRLPFTVRVKDPHADSVGRTLFMREARLPKGEPPQQPICVLNIVLPEDIIPETILPEHELHKYSFIQDSSGLESYKRVDLRLSDISNLLGGDWVLLANELGVTPSDINRLKTEHPQSVAQQGLAMLRLWLSQAGNKAQASTLENALSQLGRDDIVQQCVFNVDQTGLQLLKDDSRDASIRRSIPYSDKDIMKDSESVEDLSRTSLRRKGEILEKDDKEEKKYEAEEKEVEEENKSVSERRKEIEKRLSFVKPVEKNYENLRNKITKESGEEFSEKEIAEEKRVSSPDEEPSELSFEQKRLSFEQGNRVIEMKPDKTTMKEVKERSDERFLAEERRAAEERIESEALQEKKTLVDDSSIPFQEKRKSFEQGLKDDKVIEKNVDTRKEELRRDSALFEGVSQGLVRLDVAFTAAPQVQDLLSPKASKTPPPSPAEFKDITGTVAWTEEPAAMIPAKKEQSQDWAEKGKPGLPIDPSNKGTSRKHMMEELQNHPGYDESNISVTSTITPVDSKPQQLDTAKTEEKELKYQFTMSVPDKKSYEDTLSSIETFLKSEKNYSNQLVEVKPDMLSTLAEKNITSSDETEESHSRSEVETKLDKSFMGKVSKKLFGVFKKDDKKRVEKGGQQKNKKLKISKNDVTNEGITTTSPEKFDTVIHCIEGGKATSPRSTRHSSEITEEPNEKTITTRSGQMEIVDGAVKSPLMSDTGNVRHKTEKKTEEEDIHLHDVKHSNDDFDKGSAEKMVSEDKYSVLEANKISVEGKHLIGKTMKTTEDNNFKVGTYDVTGDNKNLTETFIVTTNEARKPISLNVSAAALNSMDSAEGTTEQIIVSVTENDCNKIKNIDEESKSCSNIESASNETVDVIKDKNKSFGGDLNTSIGTLNDAKFEFSNQRPVRIVESNIISLTECGDTKTKFNNIDTFENVADGEGSKTSHIIYGERVAAMNGQTIAEYVKSFDGITKEGETNENNTIERSFNETNNGNRFLSSSVVYETGECMKISKDNITEMPLLYGSIEIEHQSSGPHGKDETDDLLIKGVIVSSGVANETTKQGKSICDTKDTGLSEINATEIEQGKYILSQVVTEQSKMKTPSSHGIKEKYMIEEANEDNANLRFERPFDKVDSFSHDMFKDTSTTHKNIKDNKDVIADSIPITESVAVTIEPNIDSEKYEPADQTILDTKENIKNTKMIGTPNTNNKATGKTCLVTEVVDLGEAANVVKKSVVTLSQGKTGAEEVKESTSPVKKISEGEIFDMKDVIVVVSTTADAEVAKGSQEKGNLFLGGVFNEVVDALADNKCSIGSTFTNIRKSASEITVGITSADINGSDQSKEVIDKGKDNFSYISTGVEEMSEAVKENALNIASKSAKCPKLTDAGSTLFYDSPKNFRELDCEMTSNALNRETAMEILKTPKVKLLVVNEGTDETSDSRGPLTGGMLNEVEKDCLLKETINPKIVISESLTESCVKPLLLEDKLTQNTINIGGDAANKIDESTLAMSSLNQDSTSEIASVIIDTKNKTSKLFDPRNPIKCVDIAVKGLREINILSKDDPSAVKIHDDTDVDENVIPKAKKEYDPITGPFIDNILNVSEQLPYDKEDKTVSSMKYFGEEKITGNDQIMQTHDDIHTIGKLPLQKEVGESITPECPSTARNEPQVVSNDMFMYSNSALKEGNIFKNDSSIEVSPSCNKGSPKIDFVINQSDQAAVDCSKTDDDKLNTILIDMLIEQECMKSPPQETSTYQEIQPHSEQDILPKMSTLPEKHDTEVSEKVSMHGPSRFKTVDSFGKIESIINESGFKSKPVIGTGNPVVTTPTMRRKKIGGSQRLSREERPALRDVSHLMDYSSSEDDDTNYYIVTEPSDRSPQRKVTFHVESEDEGYLKVSDSSSEPEIEVTEMTPSPIVTKKKQGKVEDGVKYLNNQSKSKTTDKNTKKVERRFERMASETLDGDPTAKYSADREFQRMVSQLSNEEVDACLNQWDEGGLTPSEELDSTKDTIEGDLDPDLEALPEAFIASTNPFYPLSSQWVDIEHNINDVPSSIFWAFETAPTGAIIQPSELDIPVQPMPVKGEPAGEEATKSPVSSTPREGEEALLDVATGLQDTKGSGSGSSAK